jgi:DNA-binding transcriptional ArsR family regulator
MPFAIDADGAEAVRIEVRPSAVLELSWLVYQLEWGRWESVAGLREEGPALRAELVACAGDGQGCLTDLSILAERMGALLTDDADVFLRGMERAAALGGAGLELRSESPEDRQATLDRLDSLRREPAFARRYREVLSRIWQSVRSEWEGSGREIVLRTCAEWSQRLSQGAGLTDLVPSRHIVHRAEFQRLMAERRRVVVSPMHFSSGGGSLVDMTTFVHMGAPARPADPEELRRKESEVVASRLKVLADGTRVALLRELTSEPASVMDLARRFRLAQPTVSNHVRLLRDAGLLESRKDGQRVVYSVTRDRLDRLLSDTRHILLEH